MKMKTPILLAAALLVSVSFGQAATGAKYASLASARAKITRVIENPKEMTDVMKTLSPEDQKTFFAEVMNALATMPADETDRTATYVEVVNAGLSGAQKGNALTLVAEVFATVPPNALAAVNESLAGGLMNRAADKNATYTAEQYIKIAQSVMEKVNERVANEDNAGVRSGFAALMLIRGSNSESPEITSAVVNALPENVQNDAKTEWIPAALGQGQEKTYDPMLAVTDGDVGRPVNDTVSDVESLIALRVAANESHESLLADITGANTDPTFSAAASNPITDAVQSTMNYELPNLSTGDAAGDPATTVGEIIEEAKGYQNQTTKATPGV